MQRLEINFSPDNLLIAACRGIFIMAKEKSKPKKEAKKPKKAVKAAKVVVKTALKKKK